MSKAVVRPRSFAGRLGSTGWLLVIAGLLAVLGPPFRALANGPAPPRLSAVSAKVEGQVATVVIEATEPVPYVATQPDPFTVVIELRNVTIDGAVTPPGTRDPAPIAGITVAQVRAEDGASVARVRISLLKPLRHTVRSSRNLIYVQFEPVGAAPEPETAPAVPAAAEAPAPAVPEASQARPPAGRTATVLSGIRTEGAVEGDAVRIVLTGNGRLEPGTVEPARDPPPRLVVDLPNVSSTVRSPFQLAKGPVRQVRVATNSRDPLVTRVVFDLRDPVAHQVDASGDALVVSFGGRAPQSPPPPAAAPADVAAPVPAPAAALTAPPSPPPAAPAPPAQAAPPQPAAAAQPALGAPVSQMLPSVRSEKQYSGFPVSFDFTGADLRSVIRTFADDAGLNIVLDPAVQGTVDVNFRDVPWDQALDLILRSNKLGYTIEGSVVRIAPLTVLAEEEAARQKLAEAQAMAGQLRVLTRAISYAKGEDLKELLLKSALTQRGQIQVDARTNTIIITDLPSALATAETLINTLDRPQPQVEIEARIVQTTRDSARALGVQWGVSGRMASDLGNPSPFAFPAQAGVEGRTGLAQGRVPTGVNLPVVGATSAIGIAMGTLNGAFNLDVALSALEKKGQGRVLSTPRVMMQNNVEAEVTQGIQIPIQTISNNTVTVTFKDAALTLRVTPQITASETVIMSISLENATPDYTHIVNGIPPINTQRARTQVLVNDNETTVIGGIVVSSQTSTNDKVPALNRIPLLGWLFKRDSSTDESRELLIFITPRIVKQ